MVTVFWFVSPPHAWRLVSIGIGDFRHSQTLALHLVGILFQGMPGKNVWPPCSKSQDSAVCLDREVCAGTNLCRRYAFLAYKRRVGNTIPVKMLVRQSPSLLDLSLNNQVIEGYTTKPSFSGSTKQVIESHIVQGCM